MSRKLPKYINKESIEFKESMANDKFSNQYKEQRRVNRLTDAEIISEIFSGKIKNSSSFYVANKEDIWRNFINSYTQKKKESPIYRKICTEIAKISDTYFKNIDNVKALNNIYINSDRFIRNVEDWCPKRQNTHLLVSDLIRHLFAKYPVPSFLDKGFIGTNNQNDDIECIELFIHIGSGQSLKKFSLIPDIKSNNKIYHYLFSTPDDYNFFEAFRRSQVLALGGDERLANSIVSSKLNDRLTEKQDDFWSTTIQFFVNTPMFDVDKIPTIIDYISNQKYERSRRLVDGVWQMCPPIQPGFSMKGRTINSLLTQTEEWHAHINRGLPKNSRKSANFSWDGFNINNWAKSVGKDEHKIRYDIIQLLSSGELAQEGRDLGHCVSSYVGSCSSKKCAIFSLRSQQYINFGKPILTIEVRNNMQIVQIKGKSNRQPSRYEFDLVSEWANKEGLSISSWVTKGIS